jgi:ABC-type phosphate/phosphonate transport system substrate-binding protein
MLIAPATKELADMTLRTWPTAGVCWAALCGILFLLIPSAKADDKPQSSTLRIGTTKSMFRDTPAPLVQFAMRPFKAMLESETGMKGEIVMGGEAEQLGQDLTDNKVQLGVFQGIEFAWARLKNPKLQPLIICVNKEKFVKAVVLVRADSEIDAVGDLHGKDITLPRMSREHCHLFLQRRCADPEVAPEKSFNKIITPANAEDALDDVVDSVVSGAVVDLAALEAYKASKPGRAGKLKVLLQSEPFPCGIVACNPGTLDEATIGKIKTALLNAGKTQQGKNFLEMCRITGFQPVPDNYEQLFKDVAKAYPPTPAK